VLDNTIPQTAAISRDDASFSVAYDGDPDFGPIEEIDVEYARNTSAAVFRYGKLYYACDDGVWYVANGATGPWTVATEVPDAIYRIPASNPHHNVTYVKVYDVTPELDALIKACLSKEPADRPTAARLLPKLEGLAHAHPQQRFGWIGQQLCYWIYSAGNKKVKIRTAERSSFRPSHA